MKKLIHLSVIGVVSVLAIQASMASTKDELKGDLNDQKKAQSSAPANLDAETQAIVERAARHARIDTLKVGTGTLTDTINTGILKGKTQIPHPKLVRANSTDELQAYEDLQKTLQDFATAQMNRARSVTLEDSTKSDSSSAVQPSNATDVTSLLDAMEKLVTGDSKPTPASQTDEQEDDSTSSTGDSQEASGPALEDGEDKDSPATSGSKADAQKDDSGSEEEPAEEPENEKQPAKKAATPAPKAKSQPAAKAPARAPLEDRMVKVLIKGGETKEVKVRVFPGEEGKKFKLNDVTYDVIQAKAKGFLRPLQDYGIFTPVEIRDSLKAAEKSKLEAKKNNTKLHGKKRVKETSKHIERAAKVAVKGKARKDKE